MSYTNIWWIRRDIRLYDNAALNAATQNTDYLIPLFIIEPELMEKAAPKRRAFLLNALADLDQQLKGLGSRLIIRQGPALKVFQSLKKSLDDLSIFAHEDFSPFARQRDEEIAAAFNLQRFPGVVLRHPTDVLKSDGNPYIVFTPYKNTWYQGRLPAPANCIPTPGSLPPLPQGLGSENLPTAESLEAFPATAEGAQQRLSAFIQEDSMLYQSRRDLLNLDGTSRLSPYLRFGLLSARETFAQAQLAFSQAESGPPREEIQTWMDELVWREFYTSILYHFPHVMAGPFREDYKNIPWRNAPQDLKAWQMGQTGYPVVDACMRQLLETGWMHNRGRMIVASFLTKDLLINWQEGEAWFMANLVDGDPAANNGGWQWSAGTGTDAAPYFRIFNPVTQGLKFDPNTEYIARWVPELRELPIKYRHEPWQMAEVEAQKYDFQLGRDYPHPIVDHKFARQRTLAAYKSARQNKAQEEK